MTDGAVSVNTRIAEQRHTGPAVGASREQPVCCTVCREWGEGDPGVAGDSEGGIEGERPRQRQERVPWGRTLVCAGFPPCLAHAW